MFGEIGASAANVADGERSVMLLGGAMLLIGIAFKLSLAPFHLWTPDVYEGAPAPVTLYLSTASKIAVFALLLRYFVEARAYQYGILMDVLSVLAILSIVIGNVLALQQQNLKRLLAYSSIAHFGYLLVAVDCLQLPGDRGRRRLSADLHGHYAGGIRRHHADVESPQRARCGNTV